MATLETFTVKKINAESEKVLVRISNSPNPSLNVDKIFTLAEFIDLIHYGADCRADTEETVTKWNQEQYFYLEKEETTPEYEDITEYEVVRYEVIAYDDLKLRPEPTGVLEKTYRRETYADKYIEKYNYNGKG